MGKCIVKLAEDEYVEWSTVVDAPISYALPRRLAVREWGEVRILDADERGTSMLAPRLTLESVLEGNRAGEGEATISLGQIRRRYRRWRWWHRLTRKSA